MSILSEVLKLILQTIKAKKKNLPRGDINEGRNKKESIMKEVRLVGVDLKTYKKIKDTMPVYFLKKLAIVV